MIAIVDDEEPVREALFDLLEAEGLAARPFDSAVALLADPYCAEFSCIISDVRMPGIHGLELQQRLLDRGLSIPLIFITASVNEATRNRALARGAAAWFTKPVPDDALLEVLRKVLG